MRILTKRNALALTLILAGFLSLSSGFLLQNESSVAAQGATRSALTNVASGNVNCPNLDDCRILNRVRTFTRVLSAVVGVVVVIMIVAGGVQYSAARDNPQAVAAARQRIVNAVLALVIYLGMVSFLQWLVPGGVFF